ncbi:MAG TPA: SMC-Scp complex subunit ScpB [candidate division Zixibacteria bacterium]|nr:SMC-Scp complex subunit ScpB [candidate division Zixibacteria bacterium]
MEQITQHSIIEALILSSPEPLPGRKIADVVEELTPARVGQAVAELNQRYMEIGSSFRIRQLAGGFQFYVVPEFAGYVQELFTRRRKMRLTRASLETLAIVAYRQPVTKTDVEHVRGVASDGVIHNLLERNLIAIRGRAETVGKPLQYGTTDEFLKFFGLAGLHDLPRMSEIEELIKAEGPQDQTEFDFSEENGEDVTAQKLNVADGTYDPASREDDEEGPVSPHDRPDESTVADGEVDAADDEREPELVGSVSGETTAEEKSSDGIVVDMDTTRTDN